MENRRSDDPGRRGEDQRFQNIQTQLATTKQALTSLEETVTELRDELKLFDASVYGGVRDKDSIHFRLKHVEHVTDELYRVVIGGERGDGGVVKMISGMSFQMGVLKDLVQGMNESRKDRLTRWSAVGVAIVTTIGLVFTSLDKIALGTEKFMEVFHKPPPMSAGQITQEIERMKKIRGPAIEKKLKEIAEAAKNYQP